MKFSDMLRQAQQAHDSMLCVGLDPEPSKFPADWRGDAARTFEFCAAIVDATRDLVCAFKPQIAYFAAQRAEDTLERLIAHIHRVAPGVPVSAPLEALRLLLDEIRNVPALTVVVPV